MNERVFLNLAIEELEQTQEELEYWKEKYSSLEQTCRELVDWVKDNIKTKGESKEIHHEGLIR